MKARDLTPIGEKIEIGRFEFTAEKIIAFAGKFDPQYFHLDAERARESVLGGLCASGWHITAAMMKCNVETTERQAREALAAARHRRNWGPRRASRTSNGSSPSMPATP